MLLLGIVSDRELHSRQSFIKSFPFPQCFYFFFCPSFSLGWFLVNALSQHVHLAKHRWDAVGVPVMEPVGLVVLLAGAAQVVLRTFSLPVTLEVQIGYAPHPMFARV